VGINISRLVLNFKNFLKMLVMYVGILLMYVGMYRAVTGGGEFSHKDRRRLREID
jgi:hypothetical protein